MTNHHEQLIIKHHLKNIETMTMMQKFNNNQKNVEGLWKQSGNRTCQLGMVFMCRLSLQKKGNGMVMAVPCDISLCTCQYDKAS